MANVYVIAAEENHDATVVALLDAGLVNDLPGNLAEVFTDSQNLSMGVDYTRRQFWYPTIEVPVKSTNDTGFHLWDGTTDIAPGGSLNYQDNHNLWLAKKNIDTGVVTIYNTYDQTLVVPASIVGDGTYRRFVSDTSNSGGNTSLISSPYNDYVWLMTESCQLYGFRSFENYALRLSPYVPDNTNDFVYPLGITEDWVYAGEYDGSNKPTTLHLIPSTFTDPEIAADKLLSYADFNYPSTDTQFTRHCMGANGQMYVVGWSVTGSRDYVLWRFDPPTSAPFGGPVVGGGFTDITPWDATHGPNTGIAGYTHNTFTYSGVWGPTASGGMGSIAQYQHTADMLTIISKYQAIDKLFSVPDPYLGDPATTSFGVTYVTAAGGASPGFEHYSSFITGYMQANWTPGTLGNAAWVVVDCLEDNRFLNQTDYRYRVDYTTRWFCFQVIAKSDYTAGVTPDKLQSIYVQYKFAAGSAPTAVQVIGGSNWDGAPSAAYYVTQASVSGNASALATAMTDPLSFDGGRDTNTDALVTDAMFFDYATSNIWWSGAGNHFISSFFDFSVYYQARLANNQGSSGAVRAPFIRLSFMPPPPAELYCVPFIVGATYTSKAQILRPASPQESGTQSGPGQGKLRRMTHAMPLLHDAQGMSMGVDFLKMRPLSFKSAGGTVALTAQQLYSGVYWQTVDADENYDNMWCWQITRPYPCTVVSVECQIETSENL